MADVVLEDVCKRYENGALAVDRFSLAIGDGEFLVLVGPSGCGKFTPPADADCPGGDLLQDNRHRRAVCEHGAP